MSTFEITFWACIAIVIYAYLGYGIVLYILVRIKRLLVKPSPLDPTYSPSVALIVPAFNEVDYIRDKAHNSLALEYDRHKLEIIFVTDGSSDGTEKALEGIEGIKVMHDPRRAGKAAAMNRAVKATKADVLVFCDANTMLNKEAISELVKYYQWPEVGAVSGEKRIRPKDTENASGAGEGIYWKYESALKRFDSELHTIVGAAGELMSFRASLYTELEPDTLLDDFMQSMRIAARGYRVLYEPNAYAVETASENVEEELKRKIRICAGGWQSMVRLWKVLIPFPYPILTFEYISHRVLRWSLAPLALLIIAILNLWLAYTETGFLYKLILLGQIGFYTAAWLGHKMEQRQLKVKALFVPYYFYIMNYSVYLGFWRYIRKAQSANWERAKRAA